nr:redoxin domain-containing protein [Ardenticatena sp.]
MAVGVNQPAPDFELQDLQGKVYRLSDYKGKIVVLIFWAATCDVSRRYVPYLNGFADTYWARGVVTLGIDSHAFDTEERLNLVLRKRPLTFPLLLDRDGKVAETFGVTITPTAIVLDGEGVVRYWGAIDDRSEDKPAPNTLYLENAVDALLLGDEVPDPQNEPWGCEIERTV